MKKLLTSVALLGLMAVGCTNNDEVPGNMPNNSTPDMSEEASYISINILTPGSAGGRAAEAPGEYEDGTDVENKVNSIRFYFFDSQKAPAPVKKNPDKTAAQGKDVYDNYYDYVLVGNEVADDNTSNTIEKTITVNLTLNVNSKNPPVYVVAVINPTDDALLDDASISTLGAVSSNFLPGTVDKDEDISGNSTYQGKFVMSNSVYAKGTDEINYSDITKLCKTAEDALKEENKTVVYVERVAARLDLTIGKTDSSKLKSVADDANYTGTDKNSGLVFNTGTSYKLYNASTDQAAEQVYVKFKGWQVTATPTKSNLIKDIDPSWSDDLFGATGGTVKEPWNADAYYRSFWAINPTLVGAENKATTATTDYQFYTYNEINLPFGTDKPATLYIHENAAKNETGVNSVWTNHETKVIVAAQLVDKSGAPLTLVEYGFKYYPKDDLLQYFADQLDIYSKGSATSNDSTKLAVTDLMYKTQAQYINDAGVEVPGGYFTYVALSTNGAGKTWYLKGKALGDEAAVNTYINNYLDSRLLLWENGQTYYYFTIVHLGSGTDDAPGTGYYGVVRNHIYKSDITNVVGLGTPVLDSDEIIYPEKPNRDGSILAANIKVLSWRVVSQGYEFSW